MRSTSLSKMASQGRQAAAAGARLQTAHDSMGQKAAEVEELEIDLAEDLEAITANGAKRPGRSRSWSSTWRRPTCRWDDLVLFWVPR